MKEGEKFSPYYQGEIGSAFCNWNKINSLCTHQALACLLLISPIAMLTTKEALEEPRRMGVKDRISLRAYLKDFEDYMMTHYRAKILDRKKKLPVLSTQKRPAARKKITSLVTP